MRTETDLVSTPIRGLLWKSSFTNLSRGHGKTHTALTKEGKATPGRQNILCCLYMSITKTCNSNNRPTDTSLPCYTVSIPSTSLTLDYTSTQQLQLKLTVYCSVSSIQKARSYLISEEVHQEEKSPFKMKRRLGSIEHLWSNTRYP